MSDFQSALDLVLDRLGQIQRGGGRHPKASRATLESFRRAPAANAASPALSKTARLAEVAARVAACELCAHLATSRTQTVFGAGSPDAEVMFIGEAPGANEDAQGGPSVGQAGQLLDKIIAAMGLSREQVYVANVLKSRPDLPPGTPGNRPPTSEEMQHCLPFLIEQIRIVQPKVLVALGAAATEGLLGLHEPVGKLRGQWQTFEETPLMITYHPSHLLRNQSLTEKRKVWEDMMLVLEKIEHPISEKQRRFFL